MSAVTAAVTAATRATTININGHRNGVGHGQPWSDEETARLLELRKQGKRIVDIAREMGFDSRRVHAKLTKLEGPRGTNHPKAVAPQERAERACLCCGGKFPSVSRFNRLCEPCGGFAGALPW